MKIYGQKAIWGDFPFGERFRRRLQFWQKPDMKSSNENGELDGVLPEIEYSALEFHEHLSAGTYGAVYRATLSPIGKSVAVKRLLVLEKEAHILSLIRHRNIVQFYGAVTKPPNFCIITEFASKGSLYNILHDKDNVVITFDTIIQWALDVASGIHYLHFEAPVTIVHRDLKSKNVVVDSNDVCKLCDFGTSRTLIQTTRMSYVGTMPWMSPEMIQSLPVGEATDAWSYGVILWELITREVPFNRLDEYRIAWMVVENGLRLTIPESCPQSFASLMKRCWEKDAKMRPNFKEIIFELQAIYEDSSTNTETERFLARKHQWKAEIEEEIGRLKEWETGLNYKQAKLHDWEQRLRKREENLEYSRRRELPSYDVNVWNEEDVVAWILKLSFNGVTYQQLADLAIVFRNQQIIGARLLLLTETDLANMGVTSPSFQWQMLREITRLNYDNKRLINFPPLEYQNDPVGNEEARSQTVQSGRERTLDLVLLFGIYVRLGAGMDSHKWKVLMDIDDSALDDHPDIGQLIGDVQFMISTPPYMYKVTKWPYVMREWFIGFNEVKQVKCVVNFSDNVRQPRNATLILEIDFQMKGTMVEKCVKLFLRTMSSRSSAGIHTSSSSSGPNGFIDSRARTSITSSVLHASRSSPALAPAWKDRSFQDAVPVLSPPPQTTKRSPLWSQIVGLIQSPPPPASYGRHTKRSSDSVILSRGTTRDVSHDINRHRTDQSDMGSRRSLDHSDQNVLTSPSISYTSDRTGSSNDSTKSITSPASITSSPSPRRGGRVQYRRRTTLPSSSTIRSGLIREENNNNVSNTQRNGNTEWPEISSSGAMKPEASGEYSSAASVQVHGGYRKWKWKQESPAGHVNEWK